jgi:palmitoyl transferase
VIRPFAFGALLAILLCASSAARAQSASSLVLAQNEPSPPPAPGASSAGSSKSDSTPDAAQLATTSWCSTIWSVLESNCQGGKKAWRGDDWDLYITGWIHHGSHTYTPEKLATLNSQAWGGGLGKHFTDENDRTHLLYALAFHDSHDKPEYLAGYGWLANWRPIEGSGLRLGGGYTAFVTLRADYAEYKVPVPGILPLGEIAWSRVSIMATYVPRLSKNGGNGDVLFVFGKIAF